VVAQPAKVYPDRVKVFAFRAAADDADCGFIEPVPSVASKVTVNDVGEFAVQIAYKVVLEENG
jgi:hypothetical protein